MNSRDRIIFMVLVVVVVKLSFDFLIASGRKHSYMPYIDTKFAEDFELENWQQIRIGTTRANVESAIGLPLHTSYEISSSTRPDNCYLEARYSDDGKWGYADFAWQSFIVYYDSHLVVMALDSTWYYD